MYCWTSGVVDYLDNVPLNWLQKQRRTPFFERENETLVDEDATVVLVFFRREHQWRHDPCLMLSRDPHLVLGCDSYLVLKCDSHLMLRRDSGSCTWNTKIVLEASGCRCHLNANITLDMCLDWVGICTVNLGHGMAYKQQTVSTVCSLEQCSPPANITSKSSQRF